MNIFINNEKYYLSSYLPSEKISKLRQMDEIDITISFYQKFSDPKPELKMIISDNFIVSKMNYAWLFTDVEILDIKLAHRVPWTSEFDIIYDFKVTFKFGNVIGSTSDKVLNRNVKLKQIFDSKN